MTQAMLLFVLIIWFAVAVHGLPWWTAILLTWPLAVLP